MEKKKNDSPEWRRVRTILKVALATGIVSGSGYLLLNEFSLETIKNGFLLAAFMVVFVIYFGCNLFANNHQTTQS